MSEALARECDELPTGQLMLMRLDALPERPDVLEWIDAQPVGSLGTARSSYKHTGERFLKKLGACPDLAMMVCTALALGMSVNLIAWRCGVSPHTLAAARRKMTDRGELAIVRLRVDALLDEVAEESLEYWLDGMRSGVIHPGQIPIPALAALTNKAQREAGIVPGTQRTGSEITRDSVLAELEVFALADAVSGRNGDKCQQTDHAIDVATVQATHPAPVGPPDASLAGAADAATSHAAGGGGGGLPAAGTTEDRWEGPTKI